MAIGALDIRKMKRSISLRGLSPEETAAKLEEILFEAISIQNSGSKSFQASAIKELEQLRKDMIAGQVNAGIRQQKLVGAYSHVIDQISDLVDSTQSTNNRFSDSLNVIQKSIPSPDTIVAALMTANPLLGYGVKVIRDISNSRREASKQKKDEARKRLEVLKNEERFIKDQLAANDDQKEVVKDQKEVAQKQKREYKKGGIYKPILEEIRDEIRRLEKIVDGSGERIQGVQEAIDEQRIDQNENIKKQILAMNELEETRIRTRKLERLQTASNDDKIEDIVPTAIEPVEHKDASKHGSLLGGLSRFPGIGRIAAGLIGAISGAAAGIAAILSPKNILSIFKPLKMVAMLGWKLLKFGGKMVAPFVIVKSIYDFLDGFMNAEDIIGKDIVTNGERLVAGVSNFIGSVIRFFDSIVEEFGFEGIDTNGLEKKVYTYITDIPNKITNMVETISNKISETVESIISSIMIKIEEIKTKISEFSVKEFIFGPDKITPQQFENAKGVILKLGEKSNIEGYTPGSLTSEAIRKAEMNTFNTNTGGVINAPVNNSTNVQNTTINNGSSNTNNTNNSFREVQRMMLSY